MGKIDPTQDPEFQNEYSRLGGFIHVNSAENYFSIFKCGVIGTYHHISEQHLDRYLMEFDFRYNNRSGLGVEDGERAAKALNRHPPQSVQTLFR
jgi:ISXO2-like transposase domain